MRVLVAPDKFKGSLTAVEVAEAIAAGLGHHADPPEVDLCPIADGGDGTVDAAVAAGFERVEVRATGPTGDRVTTAWARHGGDAVVELADVSGLVRLPGAPDRHTARTATTHGTGEVIAAALDAGATAIVLGIGGSATTDGGAGLAGALGARLADADGRLLAPGGAALAGLAALDLAGLHPRLRGPDRATVTVACDVDNPLLGPHGAAAVYGPQKGAGPADVEDLDAALARFATVVGEVTGRRGLDEVPGAGAAGGVGFGALALLDATLRPGFELLADLTGFHDRLVGADLVITGEGALDAQTLRGKGPAGVAVAARDAGVPVAALAGRLDLGAAELADAGIVAAHALSELEPDPRRSVTNAGALLTALAADLELPRRLSSGPTGPAAGTRAPAAPPGRARATSAPGRGVGQRPGGANR